MSMYQPVRAELSADLPLAVTVSCRQQLHPKCYILSHPSSSTSPRSWCFLSSVTRSRGVFCIIWLVSRSLSSWRAFSVDMEAPIEFTATSNQTDMSTHEPDESSACAGQDSFSKRTFRRSQQLPR